MCSYFMFLERLLFELSCKNTHTLMSTLNATIIIKLLESDTWRTKYIDTRFAYHVILTTL